MQNLVRYSREARSFLTGRVMAFVAIACLTVLTSLPSFATDPDPTIDLAALAGGFKNDMVTNVGVVAPIALLLMGGIIGIGFAVRWIKRAVKSS